MSKEEIVKQFKEDLKNVKTIDECYDVFNNAAIEIAKIMQLNGFKPGAVEWTKANFELRDILLKVTKQMSMMIEPTFWKTVKVYFLLLLHKLKIRY